jgi:hypothetical protein
MTEVTDIKDSVPVAVRQFVLEWGNLGERWGVNRSVSQIHALLYASKQPLAAEDIADALGIARSNVSTSGRWSRALQPDARPGNSIRQQPLCANAWRCAGTTRAWIQ